MVALKSVNEHFENIRFQNVGGYLEMHLIEKGLNSSITPRHISDGTLRFLCLMAILYNPNRGIIICIDEPELNLHFDMLSTTFGKQSNSLWLKQVKIIISTHSPQLLDWFDFENVRVFEKDENNATIVMELDKKRFEGWRTINICSG